MASNDNGALGKALRDIADESRLAYNWARIEETRRRRPVFQARLMIVTASALVVLAGIAWAVYRFMRTRHPHRSFWNCRSRRRSSTFPLTLPDTNASPCRTAPR